MSDAFGVRWTESVPTIVCEPLAGGHRIDEPAAQISTSKILARSRRSVKYATWNGDWDCNSMAVHRGSWASGTVVSDTAMPFVVYTDWTTSRS